jgi:hypothetical protein
VTIRGIELAAKIKKDQFNLRPLTGKPATLPSFGPRSWLHKAGEDHSPDQNIHLIKFAPEPTAFKFGMTYKEFYAQALLSSLPISYAVEKDLVQGREPTPENVALGASQLALALTELLAKTSQNVPHADMQV